MSNLTAEARFLLDIARSRATEAAALPLHRRADTLDYLAGMRCAAAIFEGPQGELWERLTALILEVIEAPSAGGAK